MGTATVVVAVIAGMAAAPTEASFPGENGRIAFASSVTGNSEIYTVSADGSDQRNHTNNRALDGDPTFSPDGSRIAFFSNRNGPAQIYVMNLNATGVVRLTSDPAGATNPAFSPSGAQIAFTSFRDGNADIYTMNADGTNQRRLTDSAAAATDPSYSPDGSKIAFMSFRDSTRNPPEPEIYVMNADGTAQTRLTNTDGNAVPSFSPDGSKIVFSSIRDSAVGGAADYEIYTMNADGTDQQRLTDNASVNGRSAPVNTDPVFSPDGSKIAFGSNRDSPLVQQIYTMDANGANIARITSSPGSKIAIEWGVRSLAPLTAPLLNPMTPPATTTPRPDTTAPRVSSYGLTNNPFAVGAGSTPTLASAAAKKTQHPRGTTFRYTLSEAATVTVTIATRRSGRRTGSRCVAPTPRLRRARRCARIVNREVLTRTSRAGANRVAFSGRIGSRALSPGSYLATLVATDAAQNRSRPQTIAFAIVKR